MTVSFGAATYTAAEGGTATVTVTLSADPERTVAVPITKTNERGVSDSDYSGVPASITFNSGDTEKTITFTATADSLNESGERVKLSFGALPAGVSEGTPADHGSATAPRRRQRSDDPLRKRVLTVPRAARGPVTEHAGQRGGHSPDGIQPGRGHGLRLRRTHKRDLRGRDVEDHRTAGTQWTTTARPPGLWDGEHHRRRRPAGDGQLRAATYTAAEGGTATVTVTLSADPERTVAIPVTKTNQGGATAADYSGVPVSVTFNTGQTSKTITFAATADTVDDDGESVELGFGTSLPAGVSAGATTATTVSITDDDDPAVTVSFGAATYTAAEGGTATVTVTLSADPERTVEVPITTTNQGGATAADYSGVPASVTFDAGDTSKTFDFAATADTEEDDGESVDLGFGAILPDGVSEGATDEATVSITDDDDPAGDGELPAEQL